MRLFATAVHVSLLEYFCSYVQDPVMVLITQKAAQKTTWSVVLVMQTRYFLIFDGGRAV